MALPDGFGDGQSLQALDQNQQLLAKHGYGVVTGLAVSINNGNLGTGETTLTVASGTILNNGSDSSVSSTSVTIEASDSNPRKDLVVFDTADTSLKAEKGTAQAAEPSGAVRQKAAKPIPPTLDSSVEAVSGSGDPKIPLAEVWVPADATAITSSDLFDRRQGTEPQYADVDMAQRAGIPVYSADGNAPNETLFFNSGDNITKYKTSGGVVNNAVSGESIRDTVGTAMNEPLDHDDAADSFDISLSSQLQVDGSSNLDVVEGAIDPTALDGSNQTANQVYQSDGTNVVADQDLTINQLSVTNETLVDVELTTDQSLSVDTFTTVGFDQEHDDVRNEFDLSNDQFSPDETGKYRIFSNATFDPGSDQDRLIVRVRDVTTPNTVAESFQGASASGFHQVTLADQFDLDSTNTYEIEVKDQNSSATLESGNRRTALAIERVYE